MLLLSTPQDPKALSAEVVSFRDALQARARKMYCAVTAIAQNDRRVRRMLVLLTDDTNLIFLFLLEQLPYPPLAVDLGYL